MHLENLLSNYPHFCLSKIHITNINPLDANDAVYMHSGEGRQFTSASDAHEFLLINCNMKYRLYWLFISLDTFPKRFQNNESENIKNFINKTLYKL